MKKGRLEQALEALQERASKIGSYHALIGFDGFIDTIKTAVKERLGPRDQFTRFESMTSFGEQISQAAGKSTNIELYTRQKKFGGNGPLLANALLQAGVNTRYIGTLGKPDIHILFKTFATQTQAVSLGEPGQTDAVEFPDGKLLFNSMTGLDEISYPAIIAAMGEGGFLDAVARTDLLAAVNWTMIPHLTVLLSSLLEKVLPNLPADRPRYFFFDLADPQKRSGSDLKTILALLPRFTQHGHVTLGLNRCEAQQVHAALAPDSAFDADDLKQQAQCLRRHLAITTLFVHAPHGAAAATRNDVCAITSPSCAKPIVSTGAGDHFNAGFCLAQLLGLDLNDCLGIATAIAGCYIRTGRSPSLSEVLSCSPNKS